MRHCRRIPHCRLPRLRAPLLDSHPPTYFQLKYRSSKLTVGTRPLSSHPDPSDWRQAFILTATRCNSAWRAWYADKLLNRLAVYGVVVFISGVTIVYFFALERVPITGRRRWSWLSQSTLTELHEAESQVRKALRDNEKKLFISSDYPGLRRIEAVFDRLVKASGLDGIAWEVRVVDEPSVPRALILRSGLVLITTGFFHHIIKNDDELAAVLGHEIAHVIARHSLESLCINLVDHYFTEPFAWLSWFALSHWVALFCLVPLTASWSGSLHLSRVREREADYIGLLLMADAGFNPAGALTLWTKYNEREKQRRRKKKGILPDPQFRSTHPHSASRIKSMEKWILDVQGILASPSSTTDQSVTQSRRVAAKQRRWQEFVVGRRDQARQLIEEEV